MKKEKNNNKERDIWKKSERREDGKSERATAPHTQTAHAHKQSRMLLLFLSKPLLLHWDWHLLTCTKGDVPCALNHKALCQQIMPLMNKVRTHKAGVSHAIAATISKHPSSSKYTMVSKGMVHQSITHFYLHRTWSYKILASFVYVCMLWFGCICTIHL